MDTTSISKLKIGSTGKLAHYTNDDIASKLMSMGVLPGSSVEIVSKAPFRSGYYIKVDGNCIALRTSEADHVFLSV